MSKPIQMMFNVDVELGHLLFIAGVLALVMVLRKVRIAWPAWAYQLPAYGTGGIASFWFIERISSF